MERMRTPLALLAAALAAAAVCAPFAGAAGEGRKIDGGVRNPSFNPALAYTQETEIIANTSTYGTRQSNKSNNGGGAIYGCRSAEGGTPQGNEPCIRVNNLNRGFAFEFVTRGPVAGTLMVGNGGDGTRPFTTNATGVATGLNADRVDGRNAEDLLAKDAKAADADKLDGRDADSFASAGDLAFAAVTADAKATGRGVTGATVDATTNTFTVTFSRDVDACSFTATETGAASTGVDFAVAPVAADKRSVTVDEDSDGSPAVPFHLQVIC
jgi:hypothetical protein